MYPTLKSIHSLDSKHYFYPPLQPLHPIFTLEYFQNVAVIGFLIYVRE